MRSPTRCSFARLLWDCQYCAEYQQLLLTECCLQSLACSVNLLDDSNVEGAAQGIRQTLRDAACSAGMQSKSGRVSQRTGMRVTRHQSPWFNHECKLLKRAVMRARASDPSSLQLREARRAFNCIARCKRRAHREQCAHELLAELRGGPDRYPKCFWDALNLAPPRLPPALPSPLAWIQGPD